MAQTEAVAPGHADSAAPAAGTAYPEKQASRPGEGAEGHHKTGFWTLALGSVGVVYGDIGTSPLYALCGENRRPVRESVSSFAALW